MKVILKTAEVFYADRIRFSHTILICEEVGKERRAEYIEDIESIVDDQTYDNENASK